MRLTEHVPAVVVSAGHESAAAALAWCGVPQPLATTSAAQITAESPAVVISMATYRQAGGQGLRDGWWVTDCEAGTLIVVALEEGRHLVAAGFARYCRLDESEAERVAHGFHDQTGERWLLITRPHWPAAASVGAAHG